MKVVEQHLVGKLGDVHRCEDFLVATAEIAAVIDGATDKSGLRFNGETSGRFAARILAGAVADLNPALDVHAALAKLNAALRTAVADAAGGELPASMPTASVVVYNDWRREIWRIGDCGFAVDGEVNAPVKFIDFVNGFARKALLDAIELEGGEHDFATHDPGRELIMPILSRQHLFQNLDSNSPFAYGAIDGNEVPRRFIEVFPVAPPVREIILASDGYPQLLASLEECERALAEELTSDPLRIGAEPSTKGLADGQLSFDDRAYLRLEL